MSIAQTINRKYDDAADVLYISFGQPRPAITKPLSECDGVLLRYAIPNRELCGITIYGYSTFDKTYLENLIRAYGVEL